MAKPRTPRGRAAQTLQRLADSYPGTARDLCELDFDTPFQLLVATVLSAQTTDQRVNSVTPAVFTRYPTAADLAAADLEELEGLIHPTGFFRAKARSLVALPGVGRKTANVIRSVAFGLPGLAVDTHVTRLTRLLGLTDSDDPVKIEADVCALLPPREWGLFGLRVILHGRRVCVARRPRCGECVLAEFCPSAGVSTVAATKVSARSRRGPAVAAPSGRKPASGRPPG